MKTEEQLREEFMKLYDEYDDKRRIYEILLNSFMEVHTKNAELTVKIDVLEQKLMTILGATPLSKLSI